MAKTCYVYRFWTRVIRLRSVNVRNERTRLLVTKHVNQSQKGAFFETHPFCNLCCRQLCFWGVFKGRASVLAYFLTCTLCLTWPTDTLLIYLEMYLVATPKLKWTTIDRYLPHLHRPTQVKPHLRDRYGRNPYLFACFLFGGMYLVCNRALFVCRFMIVMVKGRITIDKRLFLCGKG